MRTLLITVWLCACSIAFGQVYDFTSYSIEDGLPYSNVFALHHDSRGFLWVGTNGGGAGKFDGSSWVIYNDGNSSVPNLINDIVSNGDVILMATHKGVVVLTGDSSVLLQGPRGEFKQCNHILIDSNGMYWVSTGSGVVKCNEDFSVLGVFASDQAVAQTAFANDSTLLIACPNDKLHSLNIQTSKLERWENINGIHCVATIAKIGVLMGTNKAGIYRWENSQPKPFIMNSYFEQNIVSTIVPDGESGMWIGTYAKGVVHVSNSGSINFNTKNGLLSNQVTDLILDTEGNLWVSSLNGLQKYSGDLFVNYTGDLFKDVGGINRVRTQGNTLTLASLGLGVAIYTSQDSSFVTESNGLGHNNVFGIEPTPSGGYWFATNRGLSRYENGRVVKTYSKPDLSASTILSLATFQDKLWVGTFEGGLNSFDGKEFHSYTVNQGLSNNTIWDIEIDSEGGLWLATDDGLNYYDGTKFYVYDDDNGFPSNEILETRQGPNGDMWVATFGGLVHVRGKGDKAEFNFITSKDGLHDNELIALEFDKNGYLWLGVSRGVDKFNVPRFLETGEIEIKHYDKEDGFLGVECNQNAMTRDEEGNLWIGTINGLIKYNPEYDKPHTIPPKLHLVDARLFYEPFDWNEYAEGEVNSFPATATFPYYQNHLTFDFNAISLSFPKAVRYRYMLEGLEKSWSPETGAKSATYPNLSAGTYTFKVIAKSKDNVWTEEPVSFTFTIKPPFWQTWWFITLCVIAGITGILTYIRIRTRNLIKTQQILEAEVKKQTAEIRHQKDIIEEKNRDITDSINYARFIQSSILPDTSGLNGYFKDHFVYYQPRDIVSGDFYWLSDQGDYVYVSASDCTGHGVPGGFVSMLCSSALTQSITENQCPPPNELLTMVNQNVLRVLAKEGQSESVKDGMDSALIRYNKKTGKVEFSGAQRPIIRVRKGEDPVRIRGDKNPIGGWTPPEQAFTLHEIDVQPGDHLYMFSDGYADQFGGPKLKKFMIGRLRALFEEMVNIDLNMAEQHDLLNTRLNEWKGDQEQIDDVLVVGLKI